MQSENETLDTEIESGANEGASPDASSESGDTGEPAKAAASKQEQEPTPFHEHPRFKELVEQKNQALTQQKALEQKLAELEQRFSQPQAPKAPTREQTELESLLNDLKVVDPRLAAQIEAASKANTAVSQLQQRIEAYEKQQSESQRQAQVQAAVSKVNQMHEANKVSPEIRQLINDKLDLLAMQGKLNPTNLEAEYTTTYQSFNKFVEALKRSERETYVADKKKDAAVPASQPKGTPAKAAPKKPNWSKDPEQARQQIVNRFLKQQAANKDADAV